MNESIGAIFRLLQKSKYRSALAREFKEEVVMEVVKEIQSIIDVDMKDLETNLAYATNIKETQHKNQILIKFKKEIVNEIMGKTRSNIMKKLWELTKFGPT